VTVRRATLTLLLTALAQACSCDQVPETAVTACELSQVVPGAVKTDILFVIDDSGSMSEEQANLRANLADFIQELKASPIANDFQVGVTTTSVSASTSTTPVGEHGALMGPVLSGASGTLVADFDAQVALVGTGGSGKEQSFAAMRFALSSPLLDAGGANEGLLRPGARLAVIFLSDEDDCSDQAAPWAGTNGACHNDAGDGVDYKATVMDPVSDYVAFLKGPIGPAGAQEVRDVVLAAIAGFDATTLLPTCVYDPTDSPPNKWCCGSAENNVCVANTCGSNTVTVAGGASGLTGATHCCGGTTGTACSTTCPTAFDKGDRFAALLAPGNFSSAKTLTASVCDASFSATLQRIAGLIVSQTVPLEGAPADHHMLVVGVKRADGSSVSCSVAAAGSPEAATAGAVYEPPAGGAPPSLTFQNGCMLDRGDRIQIDVICAG
jgi:hypothetical protein